MGFVYNNTWEGFCKTYFELHGYFVTTNLFAALVNPDDIYWLDWHTTAGIAAPVFLSWPIGPRDS